MMTTPLVSIILPVYNGEMYLADAINSIIKQSFTDFQLIIINDCSTDKSLEIINALKDYRFNIISLQEKSGICKALNIGISKSVGKYIARMDADDICHPLRLEKQVEFLNSYPDIGFCGSWVKRFGIDQKPMVHPLPQNFSRIKAFAIFDNPFVHSSIMIRRNILYQIGHWYNEELAGAEDYDFWIRLMEITKCHNIKDVLLDYRIHKQSVTLSQSKLMDNIACKILKSQLLKLGINISDYNLWLHRLWSTGRFDGDPNEKQLERIEKWLIRLIIANRESKIHDYSSLMWAVREVWFSICYKLQVMGHPVLNRYFKSIISRSDIRHGVILMFSFIKHHKKMF